MRRALMMLAWVLWTNTTYPRLGVDRWEVNRSMETLEECQEQGRFTVASTARNHRLEPGGGETAVRARGMTLEVWYRDGDLATIRAVCLPDTIDPRGAKGSGR